MAQEAPGALQQQVKLDATVGTAPFAQSFDNAALTPTLLGQLGSSVAQSASNALSTKLGYNEGMNPHGDLLPPITEADKHYQQAYLAQSKNVLSLEVQKMMTEAQDELSKVNKITPAMVSTYEKQMGEGAAEILENAPTAVKAQLGAQYGSALLNTSSALKRKLIAQNKEEAISNMRLNDKNTDTAILDNAAIGNDKLALSLYQQKIQQNKKQRESGLMTSLEESTSNTAAKLSYYSGLSNSKALEARNEKGEALAKYLSSLADIKNKPDDLSFSEWNSIGNNTLSFMRHMDALQQTDKNLILSGIHEEIAAGTVTEQDILSAYESPAINKTDVNNLLTQLYSSRTKGQTKQQKVNFLTANFGDAQAFGEANTETINGAYSALSSAMKEKSPNLAPMEAESAVASMAAGSIPRFLNTISNLSRSNNAQDVQAASAAYHRVQSIAPQNVMNLDSNTYDMISAFDSFSRANPGDPQTALSQARNALITKTPDERKSVNSQWGEIYRKKFSTPSQRTAFARNMLGVDTFFNDTAIQNAAVTTDQITNTYEKYFKLTGDADVAKDMTQKSIREVYGDTWVNGIHEIGYLSVEKIANLEKDGTYFAQLDVVRQVQAQLGQYKDAFDKGMSDYYYRIKDPGKWSLSGIEDKVKRVSEINSDLNNLRKDPRSAGLLDQLSGFGEKRTVKDYNESLSRQNRISELNKELKTIGVELSRASGNTGSIEIEKVWSSGRKGKEGQVQSMNLAIIPETNTTLSYDVSQPIIGNYFIKLITKNGGLETLDAINGFKSAPIYYSPNISQIKRDYQAFHTRFGNQPSYSDELDSYLAEKAKK